MNKCIHCARAKSKRKKIPKTIDDDKDVNPGERIAIDVTGCKVKALNGYKYVHGKMDHATGKLFISFMKKKSEVTEDTLIFIKTLKRKYNKNVKFIRCDLSGENLN